MYIRIDQANRRLISNFSLLAIVSHVPVSIVMLYNWFFWNWNKIFEHKVGSGAVAVDLMESFDQSSNVINYMVLIQYARTHTHTPESFCNHVRSTDKIGLSNKLSVAVDAFTLYWQLSRRCLHLSAKNEGTKEQFDARVSVWVN